MDEFNGRRARPGNMYTTDSDNNNNNTVPADKQGSSSSSLGSFGSSMNAISFGFVATAILISMFLIMAVFERLLGSSSSSSDPPPSGRTESLNKQQQQHTTSSASDFSVLMPGQRQPTFIAQPAPLPCSREGADWPPHHHHHHQHT